MNDLYINDIVVRIRTHLDSTGVIPADLYFEAVAAGVDPESIEDGAFDERVADHYEETNEA